MNASPRYSLEILENRIAPAAGVVTAVFTAATGELVVTGDNNDNDFEVFQTGPNTFRVQGNDGTSINTPGTTAFDLGKFTKLTVNGGAGADIATLRNLLSLTSLAYSGGAGNDQFTADNLTVKGAVEVHGNTNADQVDFRGLATSISGNLTIDSDPSAVSGIFVNLGAQKTTIGGSLLFTGGGGQDALGGGDAGPVNIAKGINFNAGPGIAQLFLTGNSAVTIGKLPTGESVLYTGGTDLDQLFLGGPKLTLASGISMNGGAGSNGIAVGSANSLSVKVGKLATGESIVFVGGADGDEIVTNSRSLTLSGSIDFDGGGGSNRVILGDGNGSTKVGALKTGESVRFVGGGADDTLATDDASVTLAGGIDFTGDEGNNDIEFRSSVGTLKIGKLATGQSILATGGAGTDDIDSNVAEVTLAGGIDFAPADNDNNLRFDSGGLVKIGKFGTGQSIKFFASTDASDDLNLGGTVKLAGSVELTGATGEDEIDLDGKVSIGKNDAGVSVHLIGLAGDDTLDFQDDISLAGALTFEGGANNDSMDLNTVDRLSVKGPVEFVGGGGDDDFDLNVYLLQLGSTLTVTGNTGNDTVSIVAEGSVAGDVNVDLGFATGAQTITFRGLSGLPDSLKFKGALNVVAAAATATDTLTITNLAVAKLIDLILGEGISTVNIDNLNAGDEFKLDTGGGADVVNLERGDFFGGSVIKKLATILTGDGDDQLVIGNPLPTPIAGFPDHTRVNFLGGLTADGGDGVNDDRNDFAAENTFPAGVVPTIDGFEFTTL